VRLISGPIRLAIGPAVPAIQLAIF